MESTPAESSASCVSTFLTSRRRDEGPALLLSLSCDFLLMDENSGRVTPIVPGSLNQRADATPSDAYMPATNSSLRQNASDVKQTAISANEEGAQAPTNPRGQLENQAVVHGDAKAPSVNRILQKIVEVNHGRTKKQSRSCRTTIHLGHMNNKIGGIWAHVLKLSCHTNLSEKETVFLMSKSITQDMAYRQSLMKYAEKYGVGRASRNYSKSRSYIYFRKERRDGSARPLPADPDARTVAQTNTRKPS